MSAPVRLHDLPPAETLAQLRHQLAGALQRKGIAAHHGDLNTALRLSEAPAVADRSPLALPELLGRLVEVAAPRGRNRSPQGNNSALAAAWAGTTWAAGLVAEAQRAGETAAWVLCGEAREGEAATGLCGPGRPGLRSNLSNDKLINSNNQIADSPFERARPQRALPTGPRAWRMPFGPDLRAHGVDLAALPLVRAADAAQVLQAADVLLRSGAFGLVVADWPARTAAPPDGAMGRLLGLCQRHEAALVFLSAPYTDDARAELGAGEAGGALGSLVSLRLEAWRTMAAPGAFTLHMAVRKDKRRGPGWHDEAPRTGPAGLG
ncbi:MAG: hypothetical protein FJ100_22065 [Deltaproteobacteria bacterium]|nr:hypothetical protein [Deltaproteobacteria bacterium]